MRSKLIILGCGNSVGVPRIDGFWGNCKKNKKNERTRCSAIILKGNNSILIDTSPDIKTQLINNKIKNLSSVIYTHEHADQTNGLFELRPFFWKNKKEVNIYGNSKTINLLKKRFDYCFKKKSNMYPPIVKSNIIKRKFSIGNFREKISFRTLLVDHGSIKSVAYIFERAAYISDCNDYTLIKKNELKNLNYLILDCLKYRKNLAHFNLEECINIHKHLKPKRTILTNLHHDLDYNFLIRTLPKNVLPAYDGLKIDL